MIPHLFLSLVELQAQQSGTISMPTVLTPNRHPYAHYMHLEARLSKALCNDFPFPLLQKVRDCLAKTVSIVCLFSAFPLKKRKNTGTGMQVHV